MTDQEKKDALLKFAGFTINEPSPDGATIPLWSWPDGKPLLEPEPDLLHSLDAQAKWLWPKLTHWLISTTEDIDDVGGSYTAWVAMGTRGPQWKNEWANGDTPAEACAEATLSLIGEEDVS